MPTNPGRRWRHELTRRRRSQLRRRSVSEAEQARAAAQRDIDRQLRAWTPRKILSRGLMLLAFVVAAQHVLAHAGWRPLPLSMGWQDIVLGYPMAGVLLVIGAILLEAHPRRA